MRLWDRSFLYTICGVVALGFPGGILAQGGQQTAVPDSQSVRDSQEPTSIAGSSETKQSGSAPAIEEAASSQLPDSPGAVEFELQAASQQQSNSSPPPNTTSSDSQSGQSPSPQNSKPQRPVGTAAAEAPTVSGVTAAEPAGVAIAPAKQRRVRTILIRVGAIVGAGVALGTTLALTAGTPSKPPGAH
jgi:hypothetical protein